MPNSIKAKLTESKNISTPSIERLTVMRSEANNMKRPQTAATEQLDRKSTRLNSSHRCISYAVHLSHLHSFPTRRSSDLTVAALTGRLVPDEMNYFHSVYAKQHQG